MSRDTYRVYPRPDRPNACETKCNGIGRPWGFICRSVKQFTEAQFRAVVKWICGLPFSRGQNLPECKCRNETDPHLEETAKATPGGFDHDRNQDELVPHVAAGRCCGGYAFPASTRADVIIDWNIKSDEIAAQRQILPFNHSRNTAMLHVAMFEAVNAVEGRYLPYKLNLMADRNTSKEAAAAAAGHPRRCRPPSCRSRPGRSARSPRCGPW